MKTAKIEELSNKLRDLRDPERLQRMAEGLKAAQAALEERRAELEKLRADWERSRCEICAFWRPLPSSGASVGGCHRKPPAPPGSQGYQFGWPETTAESWCGDFALDPKRKGRMDSVYRELDTANNRVFAAEHIARADCRLIAETDAELQRALSAKPRRGSLLSVVRERRVEIVLVALAASVAAAYAWL